MRHQHRVGMIYLVPSFSSSRALAHIAKRNEAGDVVGMLCGRKPQSLVDFLTGAPDRKVCKRCLDAAEFFTLFGPQH